VASELRHRLTTIVVKFKYKQRTAPKNDLDDLESLIMNFDKKDGYEEQLKAETEIEVQKELKKKKVTVLEEVDECDEDSNDEEKPSSRLEEKSSFKTKS